MARHHAAGLVALLLVLCVAYLLRPTAGPAKLEQRLASCAHPELGELRLYRGRGHATGSHWYTLTMDPPGAAGQRPLYSSYMRPELARIDCSTGLLAAGARDSVALSVEEAWELYDQGPRTVVRGEEVPLGSLNSWFTDFKRAMAAVLAATALAVALYGWRHRPRAHPREPS